MERLFAWLSRYRRLNLVYDRAADRFAGHIRIAMTSTISRRLVAQTQAQQGVQSRTASYLSLPHHRHYPVAHQGSSGRPKAAEAKLWFDQAFQAPVVLSTMLLRCLTLRSREPRHGSPPSFISATARE